MGNTGVNNGYIMSMWYTPLFSSREIKEPTFPVINIFGWMGKNLHSSGLDTNLLDRLTATKSSFPSGVRIPRPVDPRLTGVHDEHTIAKKVQMASHSEHSSR